MKNVLWMFSQPVDKTGKSKLTVKDLRKVEDTYDISENFTDFPNVYELNEFLPLLVEASIYHEDGKILFSLELQYYTATTRVQSLWKFSDELPSEDAQWLLSILSEFYGWPIEPQFGAFNYKFEGDELALYDNCLRIFRHHGSEHPINLRQTIPLAIDKVNADSIEPFEPAAFSFIPVSNPVDENDDSMWLLLFEIEERGFSRMLCPYPRVLKVSNGELTIVNDGFEAVIKDIEEATLQMPSEEVFATCGLIVEGYVE